MLLSKICQHEDWQREPFRRFLGHHLLRNGLPLDGLQQTPQGTVLAEVNHGRWIANCPNPGCGGALVVTEADPIFLCTDCASEDNGGRPYRVVFPSARAKADIERELLKRPLQAGRARSRNWLPGETVTDLKAEAKRYGLEK